MRADIVDRLAGEVASGSAPLVEVLHAVLVVGRAQRASDGLDCSRNVLCIPRLILFAEVTRM